jgi:glycosyltransferase involved in cell wall biosynthesis
VGIPQKTQAYLAVGKPVIVAVNGDAADLVKVAQAGISCAPEDPVSIAEAVRKLYNMPANERERMGCNGKDYYDRNLSFAVGVRQMESIFKEASE